MVSTAVPVWAGPARRTHPWVEAGLAWAATLVYLGARSYRAFVTTLAVIALVPAAWGWTAYVVRSGSMEPGISTGDAVVAAPFGGSAEVPMGRVMVFDDPARPDGPHTLLHRVVAATDDGRFTTAGDANAQEDTTPVPRDAFRARAVLLVPLVGLPITWVEQGRMAPLGSWGALTVAAFLVAGRDRTPRRSRPPARPGARSTWPRVRRVAALVVIVATVATSGSANAAFTATTRNSGNTWAVGSWVPPYAKAVLADGPYAYYRLDESGGTAMADASGAARTGTGTNIAAYLQPDALPNNIGTAIRLNGNGGRVVAGGAALADPRTFSLEVWFRTTSAAGGKLIGFENTTGTASTQYDRHVFIRADGRIVYGGWGTLGSTITSPGAYNDGAWHHLVVTARPHGSQQDSRIYVDGAVVAAGTTTKTTSYSGWWRFGAGQLPLGLGYPLSGAFVGSLDEGAVYPTELSAARVAAHYAAR